MAIAAGRMIRGGGDYQGDQGTDDVHGTLDETGDGGILGKAGHQYGLDPGIIEVYAVTADIGNGDGEGEFDAKGLDGQGEGVHELVVPADDIRDDDDLCAHALHGAREMGVECDNPGFPYQCPFRGIVPDCLVGGLLDGHRTAVAVEARHGMAMIRGGDHAAVIRFRVHGYGADRDGTVAVAFAGMQCFKHLVDAFRRPDDHGIILPFVLHPEGMQQPSHEPAGDRLEDTGEHRGGYD